MLSFAVLAACLAAGAAGAASSVAIPARGPVTALAADGTEVSYATTPSSTDCDRVFVWQTTARKPAAARQEATLQDEDSRHHGARSDEGSRAVAHRHRELHGRAAALDRDDDEDDAESARNGDARRPGERAVADRGRNGRWRSAARTRWERRSPSSARTARASRGRRRRASSRSPRVAGASRSRTEGSRVTVLDSRGDVVSVDLFDERGLGGRDDREGPARPARLDARASPRGRRARVHDDRRPRNWTTRTRSSPPGRTASSCT